MIAFAWWLVWIAPTRDKLLAYASFGIQLGLNFLWSFLFFFWQTPKWALLDISILAIAIFITICAFWKHSKLAALLLVPYLMWTLYAVRLNFYVWLNN